MTSRRIARAVQNAAEKLWWWLRQVSGDAAYENYLRRAGTARGPEVGNTPSGALLTHKQFYLDALRRRFDRVSRCC